MQANPFVLRYLHDFRFAFKDGTFAYFLFSRTLGVQDTKNFTFVSRLCEDDQSYYSYTELQLNCSAANKFNKVQVTKQKQTNPGSRPNYCCWSSAPCRPPTSRHRARFWLRI